MSIEIIRLGHQGDGIADGPIFAARVLPGETVDGAIIGDRIADPKIIQPSSDRVKPTCRHYRTCGGCALQHASDDFVAGWKQEIVLGALTAQGIAAKIRIFTTSPENSRIRAAFSARKTKKGVLVGFHARASDSIVEIPDCKLLHPDLLKAFPMLGALTDLGASRKSEIRITITWSLAGLDVVVQEAKKIDNNLLITLSTIAGKFGLARLTWNGELVVEREKPVQMFGPTKVTPPAGSFLQATEHGKNALISSVQEAVGAAKHVIDLFAGCGTFSLPLSQKATVHAVESVEEMLNALDVGWRNTPNVKQVTTETRDLFRRPLLRAEMEKADAVVIDPPRAGASQQMMEVAASKVDKVVSVSCNPITFARDAKMLVDAGYEIDWIDVVDQFRWSTHIEIVASFTFKSKQNVKDGKCN